MPKVPFYNIYGDIQIRPLLGHVDFGAYRYMVKKLVFLPEKVVAAVVKVFGPSFLRSKIGCLRDRLPTVATVLIRTK
mgnify:FL=1